MACVSSLDTSITQDCDEFQIESQEFKKLCSTYTLQGLIILVRPTTTP